jgi:parvulin-like peptidyl-prolyl isomerase
MKNKMKKLFSVALAALAFGVFSAPAAADTASTNATPSATGTNFNLETSMTALFGDPVIAKGKGFEIKRSQLDELLTQARGNAAAAGQELSPVFELQVLNQLIFVQLMQPKVTDADRIKGKRESDLQFTNVVKRIGSLEALERQLKAAGMTVDELRARALREAAAVAALQRELNVSVADAEAKEYYTNYPADFEEPEKARLRDILLLTINPATKTPLSADQQQAKRKRMDELLKRARGGESFSNLAVQYSEDPNSKDNGGELPPLSRGEMSSELAAAAFSLTNNQISDVIEMPFDYCIVELLEKIPARKEPFAGPDTKTILRKDDGQYATIREILSDNSMKKQAPAYLDKLRKASGVEIVDPKLKALETAVEAAASNSPAITPEK